MKTVDKFKRYIQRSLADGTLVPGSPLPSYSELGKKLKCSYFTVHSAMMELQRQGLVSVIHGKGSYVAGGEKLKLCIRLYYEMIDPLIIKKMLSDFLDSASLNLEVELFPNFCERQFDLENEAVISIGYQGRLPASDFSGYEGFAELMQEFKFPSGSIGNTSIPYVMYYNQLGINGKLLKKVSYTTEQLTPDFVWWQEFVRRCRQQNICPAAVGCNPAQSNTMNNFNALLIMLAGKEVLNELTGKQALFDTAHGRRFLQIINDSKFYNTNIESVPPDSFFQNKAVFNFTIGSWIAVQNNSAYRPDIRVDDLQLLSYRAGSRRLMPCNITNLSHWVPTAWSLENRLRIWKVIRHMLSREFLQKLCDNSGFMCCRKDIAPDKYQWLKNGDFASFLPQKDDIVLNNGTFWHRSLDVVFGTLIELFKSGRLDADTVLELMDVKKNDISSGGNYLGYKSIKV